MDLDSRMQRLEQVVLGIGTDNGMYREVKAIRQELNAGLGEIKDTIALEAQARKAGDDEQTQKREAWESAIYRRIAIAALGIGGSVGGGVIVALLVR